MAISGSCLCGAIRYEVSGRLTQALHCHCSMCRKSTGSAFRTRALARSADFRWTAGSQLLSRFASSEANVRTFCSVCGSPLVTELRDHADWLALAMGSLDDDPGTRPRRHVFVGSKAPWYSITDDLPQFEELPPERGS